MKKIIDFAPEALVVFSEIAHNDDLLPKHYTWVMNGQVYLKELFNHLYGEKERTIAELEQLAASVWRGWVLPNLDGFSPRTQALIVLLECGEEVSDHFHQMQELGDDAQQGLNINPHLGGVWASCFRERKSALLDDVAFSYLRNALWETPSLANFWILGVDRDFTLPE